MDLVSKIEIASRGRALTVLSIAAFISSALISAPAFAASVEDDFKMACAACHTIGGGRLVGPDLAGINERRDEQWLFEFVRSSQALIASGDADAKAVFDEYNGLIMPDSMIPDDRIKPLLVYIEQQSAAASETASADEEAAAEDDTPTEPVATAAVSGDTADVSVEPDAATMAQVALGQELFQGTTRFESGGPACNACHDIRSDAVTGGGVLAKELTTVFSTMGGAGLTAVIGQAPFPVMQVAYADHPLAESEVAALVTFLDHAGQQANQRSPNYGLGLFTGGVVGSAVVFGLCGAVWRKRRIGSVNQDIYDRQGKSS